MIYHTAENAKKQLLSDWLSVAGDDRNEPVCVSGC